MLDADEVRAGPLDGAWTDAVLRDLRLGGLEGDEWRLTDCRLEGCDLSAAVFTELVLTRVELVTCRLTGADLGGATLRDVRFAGCKLDDASLRFVRGERVTFADCVMTSTDLQSAVLQDAVFEHCRVEGMALRRCDLTGASFPGVDLTGVIAIEGLRGARLTTAQVFDLAPRLAAELGIVVADD